MQRNVLEYLEHTVKRVPEKIAYGDDQEKITFLDTYHGARAIGTYLYNAGHQKEPIVVFMGKHPRTIVSFFGVVYSGNYYVPIDEEIPKHRIELIIKSLQPKAMICDEETKEKAESFGYTGKVYLYEEMVTSIIDDMILSTIRGKTIDTDPIYIVFTSGSTGIPKGVVACHRSVIDFIENLSQVLEFDENTIFGQQVPLYVDACLKEVYSTMKLGSTNYLIPKNLFMFPIKLVEFMNEYKINTVCWVVSALTIISGFGTFKKLLPKYLRTIAFGSEVFPIKQFNLWKQYVPDAKYFNLYGPTEATGMSCYYEVNREFELDETIPVGKPFYNTEILLINDKQEIAKEDEVGEICIRGTGLTLGYYNDFDKTREVFIQNPLNPHYPELIYCTGDLGKYNEFGELLFISRKDNQIKHMGHRIELGEIEIVINMMDKIQSACCLFDENKKKILLFYAGDVSKGDVAIYLKEKLPRYMVPNVIHPLEMMPLTTNGKINRNYLKEKYIKKVSIKI
jgi:amino acid adenylation domain-containing protein